MDKIYEFNGKHYCETDLSMLDDLYAGDLFSLYWDASHGDLSGCLCDQTIYFSAYDPTVTYESAEELVEDYFEDSVIGEVSDADEPLLNLYAEKDGDG